MSRSSSRALRRNRRGAVVVETALLLPFLCFGLIATIDFGRVFYYSLTVTNCARNGALYGSADAQHAGDTSGIRTAALADAGNLNPQLLKVQPSSNGTNVTVTVTYPFTTITKYPGIPSQTNLSRTIRMSILPATPDFN
jgi:Flp pilus assembly protein TadG